MYISPELFNHLLDLSSDARDGTDAAIRLGKINQLISYAIPSTEEEELEMEAAGLAVPDKGKGEKGKKEKAKPKDECEFCGKKRETDALMERHLIKFCRKNPKSRSFIKD